MKNKKILFYGFGIINVLIFVYLIFLLGNLNKISNFNFLSEGRSPTIEAQKRALIYVYPALFIYITCCIICLINKIGPRKIMYPIATIIFAVFGNVIGVIISGGSFIWSIFFTFLPMIWLIVMSIEFGEKIDEKYKEAELAKE